MKAKNVLYAAVGAPVVAARKVGSRANDLGARISEQTSEYTEGLEKAIEGWAVEGEKVVGRISDGKVIDEITAKVDLDQAKEQVSKLRDQLEDMLATWRTSFRPEKADTQVKTEAPATKAPATKAPANKAPAKKPAAKKPATTSAAKTTKSTAAKTSSPTTRSATKAPATEAPATKAEKAS
jgi:hypothetical protein